MIRIAQIAATIVDQLGGQRFKTMTGAKHLAALASNKDRLGGVSFRLPGARGFCKQGINYVAIELTPQDQYTMIFGRFRGGDYKVIAMYRDFQVDQLRELFTEATGLRVSL